MSAKELHANGRSVDPIRTDRESCMSCALCASTNTFLQAEVPDNAGVIRAIFGCRTCSALTPKYELDETLSIANQIAFHEDYWREVDARSLQEELDDLTQGVESLQSHLGDPGSDSRILEIGAGRGGLLKALRNAGYNAVGCEPATALVNIGRKFYGLDEGVLLNVDAERMLQSLSGKQYRAIFLWHVIEHLSDPLDVLKKASSHLRSDGRVIIQVPLLYPDYIYPEHYFFCSHQSFFEIAERLELHVADILYDEENLFATGVFSKSDPTPTPDLRFLELSKTPDAISQINLLTERSRSAYRSFAQNFLAPNSSLAAWEKLAKDRQIAIEAMEELIRQGQEASAAQAAMIKDRDAVIVGWKALAEDRGVAVQAMERIIAEQQIASSAQATMIEERDVALAAWKRLAEEREKAISAMEMIINNNLEAISAQGAMIDDRDKSLAAWIKLDRDHRTAFAAMEKMIVERDEEIRNQAEIIAALNALS